MNKKKKALKDVIKIAKKYNEKQKQNSARGLKR